MVTGDLTRADTTATAALAMGGAAREWLEGLPDLEAFAVLPAGGTWWTAGFARYAAQAGEPDSARPR